MIVVVPDGERTFWQFDCGGAIILAGMNRTEWFLLGIDVRCGVYASVPVAWSPL